jgi:hypothetical protein
MFIAKWSNLDVPDGINQYPLCLEDIRGYTYNNYRNFGWCRLNKLPQLT